MSSGDSHLAWLYEQLPTLVSQGVLDEAAAKRLREHFGEARSTERRSLWAFVLFGILGAVLIGSGLILLIGHNWETMSHATRAVVAFLPLLGALGLGVWMILTDHLSTAWRESVGTLQALAFAACLGLVSQTYHLGGNFGTFCLVCALMTLPIAYVFRSTLPAIAYGLGISLWLFNHSWWHARHDSDRVLFWLLLCALLPLWWLENRRAITGIRTVLIGWTISISGSVAWIHMFGFHKDQAWNVALSGWFAFLYLAGVLFERGSGLPFWRRPLQSAGFMGSINMAIILGFAVNHAPSDIGSRSWAQFTKLLAEHPLAWLAFYGWAVVALALWGWRWRRPKAEPLVLGAPPLLAFLQLNDGAVFQLASLAFSGLVFAAALLIMARGIREQRLSVVNAGMVSLAALIMARFFDADLSMVARALIFITLGLGFLITNILLMRRKHQASS